MIELDPKYKVNGDVQILFEELVPRLPTPLVRELRRVEEESRPEVQLSELCLSLIPMTFQYFALVLSGEYLASGADPDFEVVDSLLDMMNRSQVGKWDNFIRQSTRYFDSVLPLALSQKGIEDLHFLLLSIKRPRVRVFDEDPKGKRLDYAEALAHLRNRYVHDHDVMRGSATEIFTDYLLLYREFLLQLRSVFDAVPLIWDQDKQIYLSIDSRDNINASFCPDVAIASIVLWNPLSKIHIRLFPLLLPISEEGTAEAAFLREVKGKNLLYPYKNKLIRKTGEEFTELTTRIEARTPKTIPLTGDERTAFLLGERIDRLTRHALSEYKDSLKYIPEIYLKRAKIEAQLDEWVESETSEPGCILLGEPGVGKTSLVAHWCEQRQKDAGNHVLLMEASKLENSNVRSIIEQRLRFSSELTLSVCFERIKTQIKRESGSSSPKRFVIVFEAVNEYAKTNSENNRFCLWREINGLVGTLDGYRPYLKCLITTRSDIWKSDFPDRTTLAEKLSQGLYYGDEGGAQMGFPCLQLGCLNDSEAENIYEDARRSKLGMSPLTDYRNLSDKTKLLVRNPYSLRLLLQGFHHKDVPSLTARKLNHHFVREMVLEETEKRTLLFRMLNRIGELKKTEITLEELLLEHAGEGYQRAERKLSWRKVLLLAGMRSKIEQERIETKAQSLEKIIFDDKPNGPYRRLLEDGIIAEHTIGEGENTEVQISFAQEKTIDIMYAEFQKRDLKGFYRRATYVLAGFVLLIALVFATSTGVKARTARVILMSANELGIPTAEADNLSDTASALNGALFDKFRHSFSIFLGFCALYLTFPNFLSIKFRFLIMRHFKADLFARFLGERLMQQFENHQKYFFLPAYVYCCYLLVQVAEMAIKSASTENIMNLFADGFVPILLLLFLAILPLRFFVILRFAPQPEAVYTLFGRRAAKLDFLRQSPDILILVVLLVLLPSMLEPFNFRNDTNIMSLHRKWTESTAYKKLQTDGRDAAKQVLDYVPFFKFDPNKTEADLFARLPAMAVRLRNRLLWPFTIGYILLFILEWILARPLERFTRYRAIRNSGALP